MECEIIVIGAGVAGLAAAGALKRAGHEVLCLEATDRIGGRVWTVHDSMNSAPIELGAEFVHGRPPEVWNLIRSSHLTAYEHATKAIHFQKGRIVHRQDVGAAADELLTKMPGSSRKKDASFEDYLQRSRGSENAKAWARLYIEGFNAARSDRISIASLVQDAEAADKIEGDRAYRILNGYDSVVTALLQSIPEHESTIRLNTVVENIKWRRHHVEVRYHSALDNRKVLVKCRRLVVTIPLGVLQAATPGPGTIQFDPKPAGILKAAKSLEFGQVYRLAFRFSDAFWEEDEALDRVGFLISREPRFAAWWTTYPVAAPILTAWMAGSAAERFTFTNPEKIAGEALASLTHILGRTIPRPEAFYFHDWRRDPFFRGAYSYTPAGALHARTTLSEPVENTLFFAGEATETKGHSGTVHGAIATGLRAAQSIQEL